MKSSTTPYEIDNCPHCSDSGYDHAEDNFCSCAEGDKLLSSEMKTTEDFTKNIEIDYMSDLDGSW